MTLGSLTPIAALTGGLLMGGAVCIFTLFNGTMLGISGMMRGIVKEGNTYLNKGDFSVDKILWRLLLIFGLSVGGYVMYLMQYQSQSLASAVPNYLLVIAGCFMGIGMDMANGCDTGHGVSGLAIKGKRSVAVTTIFILVAIGTVYFMKQVF